MNLQRQFATVLPLAALLLGGCETLGHANKETAHDDSIESSLEQAATLPPPAPAAVELPTQVMKPAPEPHRFDIDAQATPARAFFMALVDETPQNLVVHPEVDGQISLTLKEVTLEEVLEIVSEVYGFHHRRTSAGYVILPATLQTRIFQVDYLDMQRSGVSRTRVSSGQVSEGSRSSQRGGASVTGMPVGGNNAASQNLSGSKIETSYDADFWTELRVTLQQIIGDGAGHDVVVNSQTGVIVVNAMPDKLRSVATYLERIEDIAQRQVVLEAKIVEVDLNDNFRAGINWIAVAQNSSGDSYTGGLLAPPAGYTGNLPDLGGTPIELRPGNPLTSLQGSTIGGALTMAFDIGDFNMFLELLEQHGETRVLSSPRVSTLNNQKAVIKAGTDEFFVTDIASNTVTGTSSTTSRDVTLTPFFSGIALDVTPQISDSNEVTLHIHPTVSEVTDQEKNLTVSGETDVLPLAFSRIRESDSIVRARSGQIIVIGGLMRESRNNGTFGTPFLSSIPGLGRLFRSDATVGRKTELVILLKPIVVDSDDDWTDMAAESLERVRRLGGG